MTQTAKLDITRTDQRGLTIGLNEFSGYVGVAVAGIITGYMATAFGARQGFALFGLVVIVLAIMLTAAVGQGHAALGARPEAKQHAAGRATGLAAALSTQHLEPAIDLGSVHPHVMARPATDGGQPGGAGREIRRCPGVGVLPGVPLPAWGEPQPTSAGSWACTVSCGAARSCLPASSPTAWAAPAQRLGHVAVRCRGGLDADRTTTCCGGRCARA